jgi:hypothetical protein
MGKHKIKKVNLDEFHYHEALDRTNMVAMIMEDNLINHPVFTKHKDLKKKLRRAQETIFEVYQDIGRLEIKIFEKPDTK